MQRPVHAACLQRVGHGRIAAAFVDGPFGIGVDLPNAVGLAEAGDGAGGRAPVGREFAQVAQPEIYFGRRVAMQAPLAGRRQEQRSDRAVFGGGGQSGVIGQAQIGA
ncbi:hypothetical protein G6F57_020284 [Rhizopus arrhizus]|nr:hypothetical protein G6F57_020284 [Rhizopus arrhizus]